MCKTRYKVEIGKEFYDRSIVKVECKCLLPKLKKFYESKIKQIQKL